MTQRLYYENSGLREFEAQVVSCEAADGRYEVVLDRTAFFPEGGGQQADTGLLGGVRVLDTQEKGGEVVHTTDGPLPMGTSVTGVLDWEKRFRRMQNHTGEHIVSGLVHRLFGFDNVGFHMGSEEVTIDFSGYIPEEELQRVEELGNLAVAEDVPVTALFPTPEELEAMVYRSKLDLRENVRIVTIGDYDRCACCAPHVARTGQVGIIKLLDSIRHKGGVRVSLFCGLDALDDYRAKYRSVREISALLSAKPAETAPAVRRVLGELEEQKRAAVELKKQLVDKILERLPETEGNLCIFEPLLDAEQLRRLVNGGVERCGVICAAFAGEDGAGYRYILASRSVDLRQKAKEMNAALGGRGGGTPEMIQGSVAAKRSDIEAYFGVESGTHPQ